MVSGGAGFFLPMLINFVSTPLVLSKLGPEAFGLQSLVNVIMGYLMVADMGLDIPITKLLAEFSAKNDISKRNDLLSNTFQAYAGIGVAGMLLIFLIEPYLHPLFNIPANLEADARIVFLITGVGFLGNILSMWGRALFSGIQRYDIGNGVFIFYSVASTIAGIILVRNDFGIVYFVAAKVAGFFFAAVTYFIAVRLTLRNYKFSFGFQSEIFSMITPLIGYGFLMRISGMVFSRMDQTLISVWIGISAVGSYSIPLLITTAVAGLISGIMNYTFPRSSELYALGRIDEFRNLFASSMRHTALLATYIFCFLIVCGDKFLMLWIGKNVFMETNSSLLILAVAYYLSVLLTTITNNFIVAMGGIKFFTLYGVVRGLVMLAGFVIFIKPFGVPGAALGVLLACAWDLIYLLISLNKWIKLKMTSLVLHSYAKPIAIGLICSSLLFFSRSLIDSWMTLVIAGILYTSAFTLCGILVGAFDAREKQLITRFLAKRKLFNF